MVGRSQPTAPTRPMTSSGPTEDRTPLFYRPDVFNLHSVDALRYRVAGGWSCRRARLRREHLRERIQHHLLGDRLDGALSFHEAGSIDGAKLIQGNLTPFAGESTWHARRVWLSLRGHRRDDHGADVPVHLIRRDDDAGPDFLDLAADG